MISLWDICNKQVHRDTDSKQQRIMKQHQVLEFKRLMLYRKDVHPSDLGFFLEDKEEFIKQSTVQQLIDYIAMHRKILENSIKGNGKNIWLKVYRPLQFGFSGLYLTGRK